MKITRNQLRKLIRETFNPRSTLHPKYSTDYAGDEEASVKMDDLAKTDRAYAEELYDMHGVEKGSLQNPSRINMEKLSGISDEELNSLLWSGIESSLASSFYSHGFNEDSEWENIYELFMDDNNMKALINDIVDEIVITSLADFPGSEGMRRKHVISFAGDELTKESIMEEIRDMHDFMVQWGGAPL